VYLDTSYIAKVYLAEPESPRVRETVGKADVRRSSVWVFTEFHAVLHRRMREGSLAASDARSLALRFADDVEGGLWTLLPLTEGLLRRTSALILAAPAGLFLRAGDALHLTTASEAGEREVWTGDRHMRAAAAYFGLRGRSV